MFSKHTKIDFIGIRKYFYIIFRSHYHIGDYLIICTGLNPGIDFAGGRTFVIRFDKPVVTEEIAAKLNVAFGDLPEVVTYGKQNQVKITTSIRSMKTELKMRWIQTL